MMRISEAAAACGLTIGTIRYYEKSEMLPRIRRSADGRRVFSSTDIEWLTLLYWLRETGMPLKQMRRFTALAKAGSGTVPERRDILLQHAAELHHRQALLKKCQSVLAIKIASYDSCQRGVEA
ncbi:MAG: MerR family transcriptional regulator [Pseudomonadota bacterium]